MVCGGSAGNGPRRSSTGNNPNQMMRIGKRCGLYDRHKRSVQMSVLTTSKTGLRHRPMIELTAEQKAAARPLPIFKPFLRARVRCEAKTETRRLVKHPEGGAVALSCCPYGKPGDIAYLREPLWKDDRIEYVKGQRNAVIYQDEPEWCIDHDGIERRVSCPDGYLPTRAEAAADIQANPHWSTGAWTSMTMPRWAARTFVRITEIQVEQLHEITEAGAIAEGIMQTGEDPDRFYADEPELLNTSARMAFRGLWIRIHGEWTPQVWLWVIKWEPVK